MAVEQDWDLGGGAQELEEGQAGGELVDEEGGGGEGAQLGGEEGDVQDQVQLARDGAEDAEAGEDGGRDEGVAPDADVERAL